MAASYSSLNLVLLGPPGSGKSTQARLLAETYQLPHISTHEMLRAEVAAGSSFGREVADAMERGELISDRLVSGMVLQRIDRDDCWRGFILDGYPRTTEQASVLDSMLAELGRTIERVVLLSVNEETGIERLTAPGGVGNRADLSGDNGRGSGDAQSREASSEAQVREWFRVWRDHAPALIESYRRRGLLFQVDGSRSQDQVSESVLEAVGAPVGA